MQTWSKEGRFLMHRTAIESVGGQEKNPSQLTSFLKIYRSVGRCLVTLLLACAIVAPVVLHAGEPARDALFRIERNKNANIIQYAAQVQADGTLHRKKPVTAYWVRLAEQGQEKKLTWTQRKFAYGFDVTLSEDNRSVLLDMVLNLGRPIVVKRHAQDYRAMIDINGVACFLDRVFIQAHGKGWSTRLDYIELYGKDVDNDGDQYERVSP